ncbi:MAG: site-specific integrase [Bacillus sp. (in: Bacteria)]|nr:site-specific integrase [Bacillus sp. (in: firmicutes)]MCM1424986.1 site-specific integrase [Eubacterium sp.]
MKNRKDSKGRVLKKGESQRSDGRYCYRYQALDGKRKYVYALDLNDLRHKEKKIEEDLYYRIYDEGQTLNDVFDRYIAIKASLKEGTLNNYLQQYDLWVRNTWLGNKRISTIKKSDILLFYKEKSEHLSNGSIKNIQRNIYAALQLAVEDDLIRKNPALNCTRDYTCKSERIAMTSEQTQKLLKYAAGFRAREEYLTAVIVMLGTGMRVGETVGLTWQDIDFTNKVIYVNKQFRLISGRGRYDFHISSPKTEKSIRCIPMSDEVYKTLSDYKVKKYFQSMQYDIELDGYKGFVFFNKSGIPINPQNINKYLKRLVRNYNETHPDELPEITCHILRHTFCTRMAEKRINQTTLQKLMGHSSYRITSDVYVTETDEHIKEEFYRVMNQ